MAGPLNLGSLSLPLKGIRCIVFDKDGTLISFTAIWKPWMFGLIDRMEAASGLRLRLDLYEMFNYCSETDTIGPGMLAESTMPNIHQALIDLLVSQYDLPHAEASQIVDATWQDCDTTVSAHVQPTCDLKKLLRVVRDAGIRIAVCTSDSQAGCCNALNVLGVKEYFESIVCGDDEDSEQKPNAYNGLRICRELKVSPDECIMIGDTPSDVKMGQNAKFRTSVGVLSGICGVKDFEAINTDVVLPDISLCHMRKLIHLPSDEEQLQEP